MSKAYYGLVSGLDQLKVAKPNGHKLVEFKNLLQQQLTPSDWEHTKLLFYKYDNINLISVIKKREEFNSLANTSKLEIKTFFNKKTSDSPYLNYLLELGIFKSDDINSLELEFDLTQAYYNYLLEQGNEFIQSWAKFEISLRNLSASYALKKLDIESKNQFVEGGYFSKHELKRINPSDVDRQYPLLKKKYDALEIKDPIQRKAAVDALKFQFVDEASFFKPFELEGILAHLIKLMQLNIWQNISKENGEMALSQFLQTSNKKLETLIQ
jgi:hypothetical protein